MREVRFRATISSCPARGNFVSSKIAIIGWDLIVLWDSLWFSAIILSALSADLFNNAETWTYTSLQIIENKNVPQAERISMIQSQLEIAVNRYMAVFMRVNGFDTILKRIGAFSKKIFRGEIIIKAAAIGKEREAMSLGISERKMGV